MVFWIGASSDCYGLVVRLFQRLMRRGIKWVCLLIYLLPCSGSLRSFYGVRRLFYPLRVVRYFDAVHVEMFYDSALLLIV